MAPENQYNLISYFDDASTWYQQHMENEKACPDCREACCAKSSPNAARFAKAMYIFWLSQSRALESDAM